MEGRTDAARDWGADGKCHNIATAFLRPLVAARDQRSHSLSERTFREGWLLVRVKETACTEVDAALAQQAHLFVTEAGDQVIVHQASGLHKRVADGRAYEAKAAFQQLFAQCYG